MKRRFFCTGPFLKQRLKLLGLRNGPFDRSEAVKVLLADTMILAAAIAVSLASVQSLMATEIIGEDKTVKVASAAISLSLPNINHSPHICTNGMV